MNESSNRYRSLLLRVILIALLGHGCFGGNAGDAVTIREEPMTLPTYEVGAPDRSPMFYTGESYQGAQRRIYPYPLLDNLSHHRKDVTYTALHLENQYVKLTVLPEIGGRLFAATDKTNGYDFFYRQHVIKPALVGMLGAWISGGVEWCAFHHHRNTTFMPVDYELTVNDDGSKTIWFGEIERRHRMKWLVGLTLYPDRSYIETTVRLYNRTAQPHSILYWENTAVHVNDDYQVIFPPSVNVVTHHAKTDFSHWPISHGVYCGRDYEGVDISWYRNLPNPVSFFAWGLQEDFMGGYDHGREAGVVHVGDHHALPGAKLWSWGNGGAYAQLWDGILTDDDGPYVELMVGGYSDNQPDYSWIAPYETRVFTHYWYPVRGIGGFKNANRHGAVNLDVTDDHTATVGIATTERHGGAKVMLTHKGEELFEKAIDIDPARPYTHRVELPDHVEIMDLRAVLVASDGHELIAYQPVERTLPEALPDPVEAPHAPKDIESVEQLYLTGLQIEQIHNPSVDPRDYYREALTRDHGHTRSHVQLGIDCNKRGLYREAEVHFRRAIERLAVDYTRALDMEAYYQLGLSLRAQGQLDEAIDCFQRSAWDHAYRASAKMQLAQLSCGHHSYARALSQIDEALAMNSQNTKALSLRAMILRKLERYAEASRQAADVVRVDPLEFMAVNERYRAESALGNETEAAAVLADLVTHMRGEVQSYLELATDYMGAGMWNEAIDVLQRQVEAQTPFAGSYPLVHYYLGYLHEQAGDEAIAQDYYTRASAMPADYCFPHRWETETVLTAAMRAYPSDARAPYYLGNLLFDHQPQRAVDCWNESRRLDDRFAMNYRNLGWASYRTDDDVEQAISWYEQAIERDPTVPRWYFELDVLYERGNAEPERRLAMLEPHHDVVRQHQDSLLREILMLVLTGHHDRAIDLLTNHRFHAREGGENIHELYVDAHLQRGLRHSAKRKWSLAIGDFEQALETPENLASTGSPRRAPEIAWHLARAHQEAGDADNARSFFEKGAGKAGSIGVPQTLYYQARCQQELGQRDEAEAIFDRLIESGTARLTPEDRVDYFAKFGEQDSRRARVAAAHFTIGLGLLGKGKVEEARKQFEEAVRLNKGHAWARYQLSMLSK